jgi:hypothetical protein
MAQVSFQLQAASASALTSLLITHGLLLLGEGSPRLAPGVIYSHIGDASLENGEVKLAGQYAFVSIDDSIYGEEAVASLLLALDSHIYKGPALRYLLGGSNFNDQAGVPKAVTMRQARLALLGAGLLGQVEDALNSMPEPHKSAAKITWEFSGEVQRYNGLVSQLGPALGLTEEQLDQLFIQASKL